jgi:nucleoside 2-deoxyribosyltransferase
VKPKVYLAGPISGETLGDANHWRHDMTGRLARHGIVGISPLRSQSIVGERYGFHYPDPCFGTPGAIVAKNFLDLRACDFVLAYMPAPPEVTEFQEIIERMSNLAVVVEAMIGPLDEDLTALNDDVETLKRLAVKGPQRSLGTIGEISWAHALQKPCAIVTDDPMLLEHPFTMVQPDWHLSTLGDAERLIVGLFADYAR